MRSLRLAVLASLAAVCCPHLSAAHEEDAHHSPIAAAVAATTRTPANVARDVYRHPVETLTFFGVKPTDVVLEYSPGAGWYSEILGALLNGGGTYYAAAPAGKYADAFAARVAADPAKYGKVKIVPWPPADGAIAPGSIDVVLTFRNVHNLVMSDSAEDAFRRFYIMLKPGGVLGIVDHRLPEDRDTALEKTSGYLKVSTVRRLAEQAGFVLEAESQINANPKDDADHPKGVWTLPPTLTMGAQDRDTWLAIGESDRMTLRFRKPRN